ncbi:BTB domain-containing protein [Fusarium keratoplasticum]|nr:BTB domain-containing protein [Fusarium keratoplasticum]
MGDNRGKKRPAEEAFADDLEFDRIAPNGDVTFVLDEGNTRVRVNSAVMKNASPVFAAMLGPNFKEGRALSAGDCASVDVPLPEDDAVAFGWVCRVLHSQADTNLWSPSPREIIQVLGIAEKYGLLKGIQISVQVWIDRQEDSDTNDLWLLSLACCRAHDAEAFKSATRRLIINHSGSFVQLAAETENVIPGPDAGRTVYRLAVPHFNQSVHATSYIAQLHDLFLNMSTPSPAHKRKRGDDSPPGRSLGREEVILERVAPDGDVVFVLGGGTGKVQVQSSIMKSASPVFSAMLAGHFREGQMLHDAAASGKSVEIPLPGDDFEAFKLICIAIHRQASTTQYCPTEEVLMRVLQIADKYNLVDSVFLSMEFWVRKYVPDPTLNHFLLMIICHQIKSQELFQLFSRSLVLNHGGSFMSLATENEQHICDSVPRGTIYKLACALEEMRATMMRRITKFINAELMARFNNGHSDNEMSSDIIPYYRLLRGVLDSYSRNPGLHSVGNDYSISDLTSQILKIETSFPAERSYNRTAPNAIPVYMALLRRLRGLNENFVGLCLDCLEVDKLDFDCRGVHK